MEELWPAIVAGVVAGWAVAVPVGAVGTLVVMTGARHGWRVAAAGGLGVACTDALYAALAVAGGSAGASLVSGVALPLRWTAGVVLAVLGVMLLRSALRSRPEADPAPRAPLFRGPARAFTTLLGITAVNPATVVFFAALVAGGQVLGTGGLLPGSAFVAGVFAGSALWQLALAGGGSLMGGVLAGPRARRWTAAVGGAVTVLLALKTALGL